MIKILTIGTWDIPHIGHYNFLNRIKRLYPDSYLVVGVNRDEFIERFKSKKPLFSYQERFDLISSIDIIDKVLKNYGDEDSKILIKKVKPDVIVIATDWLRKDYLKQMDLTVDWLEKNNIALSYIPYTLIADISTTELKRR